VTLAANPTLSLWTKLTAPVRNYTHWLHAMWPAGVPEKLPIVDEDGRTAVPGLYIVGDLTGIPLLKFSADSGARAVRTIQDDPAFRSASVKPGGYDLVIVGGGVSGMAAALEARKAGLKYLLLEAAQPLSTILNFPKGKPIFTYPTDMVPAGDLQFRSQVKEALVDEVLEQTRGVEVRTARVDRVSRGNGMLEVHLSAEKGMPMEVVSARGVIVAIGRSGNHRKLGVPGEDSGKVFNRLHDPKEYAGKNVLVVGGGDSAAETAIACVQAGANVTFSFRGKQLDRPKPENVDRVYMLASDPGAKVELTRPSSERVTTAVGPYMGAMTPGGLTLLPDSRLSSISASSVDVIAADGKPQTLPNDVVFSMIGREAPLDFFRKSGVPIHGERSARWWITLVLSVVIFFFIYHWKKSGVHITGIGPIDRILDIGTWWNALGWFPLNLPDVWGRFFADKTTLLGTMRVSVGEGGFWYSLAYCTAIVLFGIRRIRRRKTPYVRNQTISLMLFQCIPLFFLPYIVLPWLGNNGAFDGGAMKWLADQLFPAVSYGHGREYWRAFGLILAWPLFIWNVFTEQPMWLWLGISLVQTFVLIPGLIYFYGKGVYCGWVCSCGALAETMGDTHRTKMPHGPFWNRFNMVGQVFLAFAFVLLALRVTAWVFPGSFAARAFTFLLKDIPIINYVWFVDLLWAGILGVALYWHFSGRVWCRFACPLAALMHIYARFSRFAIVAEKKKCISCNVCTSVCHQGIDIMNFANKGLPMKDPECVRCSACVQSCPTGVLQFGMTASDGTVLRRDKTPASRVHMVELKVNGRSLGH
jgi:thioredoxin reductase/Fe-S-cluster-containing hydrogenase component 2